MFFSVNRSTLAALLSFLLTTTALAQGSPLQAEDIDKHQIIRQVAKEWIEVGSEQYKRGLYKASKQSFLRALDSQEYLTAAECEKLWHYLRKTLVAVEGSKYVPGNYVVKIDTRSPIVVENKLRGNETQASNNGKLGYIGNKGVPKFEPLFSTETNVDASEQKASEPIRGKSDYISMVNRRRNILRSYTKAIVNDAVAKAQTYVRAGKFDDAREVVENAEQVVNKNYPYLGDELFRQYSLQLKELTGKIVRTKLFEQR